MENKGVSLIELLVTITILAILASIVIPFTQMTVKREKEVELRRNLRTIRTALDAYKHAWDDGKIIKLAGESGYPPDLLILVDGVEDATSPEFGKKLKFLRRIPRDPMDPDRTSSAEETWGLRSYDSDADSPREGDDVFDVRSNSEEIALDGTAYSSW